MNLSVIFAISVIPSLTTLPVVYKSACLTLKGCLLLNDVDSVVFMYLAFKKILAYNRDQKMPFSSPYPIL